MGAYKFYNPSTEQWEIIKSKSIIKDDGSLEYTPDEVKEMDDKIGILSGVSGTKEKANKEDLDSHKAEIATQSVKGHMSASDKTKLDGIATNANKYTHPTTAGNKHIPSGGSVGQFLAYGGSSGTAKWEDIQTEKKIIYSENLLSGNPVRYTTFTTGYTTGYVNYSNIDNTIVTHPPQASLPKSSTAIGTISTALAFPLTGWSVIEIGYRYPDNNFPRGCVLSIDTSSTTSYESAKFKYEAGSGYTNFTVPISLTGSYYIRVHFLSNESKSTRGELVRIVLKK